MLARCSHFIGDAGVNEEMTEAKLGELTAEVTRMASQGLRTLCLTYRDFPAETDAAADVFDFPPEEALTACCLVGIKARRLPHSASSAHPRILRFKLEYSKPQAVPVLRLLTHEV